MSPPSTDQGPTTSTNYAQWLTEPENKEAWTANPQSPCLAISASRRCGEANYVQHGDCTVCGKSFAAASIQEEITLGYLEATHEPGENYAQRIRHRNAFLAGMRAGSVIFVPGGVSQAAACDGIFYQRPAGSNTPKPPPGVLPI